MGVDPSDSIYVSDGKIVFVDPSGKEFVLNSQPIVVDSEDGTLSVEEDLRDEW